MCIQSFLFSGNCLSPDNVIFNCTCTPGWTGTRCETMLNYCSNVTCMNKGMCRPLLLDYKCQCLSDSYSGLHCEYVTNSIIIRQYVSRSLAYIAITALVTAAEFVIVLDVLKYGFDIDPVRRERDQLRRGRALLERRDRKRRRSQNRLRRRRMNCRAACSYNRYVICLIYRNKHGEFLFFGKCQSRKTIFSNYPVFLLSLCVSSCSLHNKIN
jgi:hypothetical protein